MNILKFYFTKLKNSRYVLCKKHRTFKTHKEYLQYYGSHYQRSDNDTEGPFWVDQLDVEYAYSSNGRKVYHRFDGPAVMDCFGNTTWVIHGKFLTRQIHTWAVRNEIDLNNLSEDDINLIKLTWSDYGK